MLLGPCYIKRLMSGQHDFAASNPVGNRRPDKVTTLLCQGTEYRGWFLANRRHSRFFIVNLNAALESLNIDYTSSDRYLEEASEVIATRTGWPDQYGFEYKASMVQLSPKNRKKPKRFGIAITIIVGMEIAAARKAKNFNVYDHLRIIPAHYFVGGLDSSKLKAIRSYSRTMDRGPIVEALGAVYANGDFDTSFREWSGQAPTVLDELADGYCVTKFVGEKLILGRAKEPLRAKIYRIVCC
jgi:hypothetical protein